MNSKLSEFNARNAEVFGVSMDSVHTNRAFAESVGGLDFPVLADWNPHGQLTDALGIRVADMGCSSRTTVIVDENNVVKDVTTYPIGDDRDFSDTLRRLDGLS